MASTSSGIVVPARRFAVDRFCCVLQEPVVAQFIQGRLEVIEDNGIAETFADEGYLFDSDDWLARPPSRALEAMDIYHTFQNGLSPVGRAPRNTPSTLSTSTTMKMIEMHIDTNMTPNRGL